MRQQDLELEEMEKAVGSTKVSARLPRCCCCCRCSYCRRFCRCCSCLGFTRHIRWPWLTCPARPTPLLTARSCLPAYLLIGPAHSIPTARCTGHRRGGRPPYPAADRAGGRCGGDAQPAARGGAQDAADHGARQQLARRPLHLPAHYNPGLCAGHGIQAQMIPGRPISRRRLRGQRVSACLLSASVHAAGSSAAGCWGCMVGYGGGGRHVSARHAGSSNAGVTALHNGHVCIFCSHFSHHHCVRTYQQSSLDCSLLITPQC